MINLLRRRRLHSVPGFAACPIALPQFASAISKAAKASPATPETPKQIDAGVLDVGHAEYGSAGGGGVVATRRIHN